MNRSPLTGVRVIDLSQVYAGPLAGRVLADLGAEVIRVEAAVRSTRGGAQPQPGAAYPDDDPGERPYNRSAYYNELNRNKLAISLDLSRPEGREVFLRLAGVSDVVLENFSPRVMANFSLDYPSLREINPDIIMVSLSAHGQTGPYRDYVSFGRGIEAMTGLSRLTAYPGGEPLGPGTAYADATGGLHTAFATLLALRHRRLTGLGQHIDLSLRESLTAVMGEEVLAHSMNDKAAKPKGNRDATAAFQGCYRCRGEDDWIAIAIQSEEEWEALHFILNAPAQGFPPQDPGTTDEMISRWTGTRTSGEAMQTLQDAGVRAGMVQDAAEINHNPHLKAVGFFAPVTHPEAGTHDLPGLPFRFSRATSGVRAPAPRFAQDHHYVLGELLGMTGEEIDNLERSGVAAPVPLR